MFQPQKRKKRKRNKKNRGDFFFHLSNARVLILLNSFIKCRRTLCASELEARSLERLSFLRGSLIRLTYNWLRSITDH